MQDEKLWDNYNNLLLSSDLDRIRKLIIRYELFKKVINVPGSIAECGVFKGAGWIFWLKLLSIFSPGERKFVYGFDTFNSFSSTLLDYEKITAKRFVEEADFVGIDPNILMQKAKNWGFEKGVLVPGEVRETIPKFISENIGLRFSLVNLDFDTYEGTKIALESFYPMISPGGIIILDEYGKEGWGESDAVDEFIKDKDLVVKSVPHSSQPTGYIQLLIINILDNTAIV